MKQTICTVKGVFTGLYEWGRGWDNETAEKWLRFWRFEAPKHAFFWKWMQNGSSEYLVSTCGSLFLHPMDFITVLHQVGEKIIEVGQVLTDYIEDLNNLCNACAEYCGGIFEMTVSEETTIDSGKLKSFEK